MRTVITTQICTEDLGELIDALQLVRSWSELDGRPVEVELWSRYVEVRLGAAEAVSGTGFVPSDEGTKGNSVVRIFLAMSHRRLSRRGATARMTRPRLSLWSRSWPPGPPGPSPISSWCRCRRWAGEARHARSRAATRVASRARRGSLPDGRSPITSVTPTGPTSCAPGRNGAPPGSRRTGVSPPEPPGHGAVSRSTRPTPPTRPARTATDRRRPQRRRRGQRSRRSARSVTSRSTRTRLVALRRTPRDRGTT
jgi:hypothetical protein